MNTTTSTTPQNGFWTRLVEELRERREAAAADRKMMRELDAYRSRSDIEDLLATVDRYETPEAERMRSILNAKLALSPSPWLIAS